MFNRFISPEFIFHQEMEKDIFKALGQQNEEQIYGQTKPGKMARILLNHELETREKEIQQRLNQYFPIDLTLLILQFLPPFKLLF